MQIIRKPLLVHQPSELNCADVGRMRDDSSRRHRYCAVSPSITDNTAARLDLTRHLDMSIGTNQTCIEERCSGENLCTEPGSYRSLTALFPRSEGSLSPGSFGLKPGVLAIASTSPVFDDIIMTLPPSASTFSTVLLSCCPPEAESRSQWSVDTDTILSWLE